MPPAGFTVAAAPPPPSPAEQAADLVKSKNPTQMSFAEWELVLSSGNQQAADTVWNALKDKAVKLGANVISASASKVTLAGSQDDFDDKKADITLTMAKPLAAKLVVEGHVGGQPGRLRRQESRHHADHGETACRKACARGRFADAVSGNRVKLYAEPVHDNDDRRRTTGQERQPGHHGGARAP